MRWGLALVLAGCGRIGFEPIVGDAGGDGGPAPLVESLPCASRRLLDTGGDLGQDGLAWVSEPAGDWLLVSEHVTDTDHPVRRYAIDPGPSGPSVRDTGSILQTVHAHLLNVESAVGDHVMAYYENGDLTLHTAALAPGMVVTSSRSLGTLSVGNKFLARAGGGGLAIIGVQSGMVETVGLGEDGAPSGASSVLATPAEGPALPTIVATDTGLAAVWQSAATGHCRVATLRADLSIVNGPVNMAVASCTGPQIAWLAGSRRLVVVTQDASVGALVAAVWDDALAPVVAPFQVAALAHDGVIIADGDGVWIAWDETGTAALRYAHLDSGGAVIQGSVLGQVDELLPHYHVIQRVAASTIVLWLDVAQNRSLAATRLCL